MDQQQYYSDASTTDSEIEEDAKRPASTNEQLRTHMYSIADEAEKIREQSIQAIKMVEMKDNVQKFPVRSINSTENGRDKICEMFEEWSFGKCRFACVTSSLPMVSVWVSTLPNMSCLKQ